MFGRRTDGFFSNGVYTGQARSRTQRPTANATRWPKILSRINTRSHTTGSAPVPWRRDTKPPESARYTKPPSAPENEGSGSLRAGPAMAGGPHGDHYLRYVGHTYVRNVGATRRLDGAADESGGQRRPQSGRHDHPRAERHHELLRRHSL